MPRKSNSIKVLNEQAGIERVVIQDKQNKKEISWTIKIIQ